MPSREGGSKSLLKAKYQPIQCGFCFLNLDTLTLPQRKEHCEQHFRGSDTDSINIIDLSKEPVSGISADRRRMWGVKAKAILHPFGENDAFWYPAQSTAPPSNYTPGLIPLLRKALWKVHARGGIRRAALCHENAVHISREMWDAGWGCGYRNFLMLCATLMNQPLQPLYFPLLDAPISPSIRNLQVWIEAAWKAGFDEEGANDLENLVGTNKWIGTADLWVAFTFRGIPSELVDFNLENEPEGVKRVTDWIVAYFTPNEYSIRPGNVLEALSGASPIINTDRMPLILQHNGHSRTIVGYEMNKNGVVSLLTFDPATTISRDIRQVALDNLQISSSTQPSSSGQRPSHLPDDIEILELQDSRPSRSSKGKERPNSVISLSGSSRKRTNSDVGDDSDVVILDDFPNKCTTLRGGTGRRKDDDDDDDDGDDDVIMLSPLKKLTSRLPFHEKGTKMVLSALLKRVRLDSKKLGKNKEYQILYFPMSAPLTETERLRRKIVTSKRIC